ncbi:MAG: hypothetical protein KC917_20785 [Candidatus Omnitrophica bacterium]|nr:hypothetical protein [Candidatus Omnitrophota bacterium]MCA9418724.1 hypothetical protein [Candidatus Omnitrophota bacterium]MCA9438500.1 hypothetical protein [Candidatus Omnitrophota bacterium]MCA9441479.1 hypothetical protein [Candidatus Omnitrophota bacterium]MCB9766665.1 hypothetical protein [Candidatus Omnitrophota bacterium]
MADYDWNILVGVTDHNEGADLSTHLINYGWNAEHCYSAEEVIDILLDNDFDLVILDEEIITDSEWTFEELEDILPGEAKAIILGEAGSFYPFEMFGDRIRVLIRPFSYNILHSVVELLLADSKPSLDDGEESDTWVDEEMDLGMSFDDLQEYVTV